MQPTDPISDEFQQQRPNLWKRLPPSLRTMWALWTVLAVFLAAATCLFQLSVRSVQLPITLNVGETAQVEVWRPWAYPAQFRLEFQSTSGQNRPELGEWVTPSSAASDRPAVPSLVFSKPGEPVRILVDVDGKQASYRAMPASSQSGNSIERPLTPSTDNTTPGEFAWPPAAKAQMEQAAGQSQFRFTVQEVGSLLQGEKVQLLILPPLDFKSTTPRYDWLWPLFFWPTFAALLAIFAVVLMWLSRRRLKAQSR